MGAETGIAWTDHTFNPWWGCTRVSPGCTNCYAEAWDKFRGGPEKHWGTQAPRRFFGDAHWNEPRKWNRAAREAGVRRKVFCASMADVFEARDDLNGERLRLWVLIEETPWLDWQLLTKRPENIAKILTPRWLDNPRPNAWFGTTVEDQQRADERIPHLLRTPAAVRFLSCEPLLGRTILTQGHEDGKPQIHWVIVGGESGHGARPMRLDWARFIVKQCKAEGLPVFVKQLGANPSTCSSECTCTEPEPYHLKLDRAHGGDMAEWPADLRVREFPGAAR